MRLQYPSEHGCGGCFPMRTCNGHDVTTLMRCVQEVIAHPLGPTGVRQALIQDGFHQRKFGLTVVESTATHHIANHMQISFEFELIGSKAFDQFDAQTSKLIAHGWIHACIASRHLMTRFSRQRGQPSHEGAANTQYMYVHPWIVKGDWLNRRHNRLMQDLEQELLSTAARFIVEEGLSYQASKKRAVKLLGLPLRTALPNNDDLEEHVREYIALFCSDTQPGELLALRQLAVVWMRRLEEFKPHLAGAVWRGMATRLNDIHLQLFCDDSKSAEIKLIDQGVSYDVNPSSGIHGQTVDVLSLSSWCEPLNEYVGVHLSIYDLDDIRGALQPDSKGLTKSGSLKSLELLLKDTHE